jgi:hypothetical protein
VGQVVAMVYTARNPYRVIESISRIAGGYLCTFPTGESEFTYGLRPLTNREKGV